MFERFIKTKIAMNANLVYPQSQKATSLLQNIYIIIVLNKMLQILNPTTVKLPH